MPAVEVSALPAESHEAKKARRRKDMRKWRDAGATGVVPRRQALQAIWWIRKQIIRDRLRHCLRRVFTK